MWPPWRKSSHSFSNGNCLEAASWRTAASCQGGACVEVGSAAGIAVRDSTDRDGAVLTFTAGAWRAFTAGLRAA
jgi:Domain of unknown function (DUF397)